MAILKNVSNPKIAFLTYAAWIVVFIIVLGMAGDFSQKFLHFGPSTDPEIQAEFLGTKVDTWPKVILLYVLGFLSVCFSTYYYDIYGSWSINTVRDHKEKTLKVSKFWAYFMTNMDPILTGLNGILQLFITLTFQLQFIVPQILGELLVTMISSQAFLSQKKKFAKTKL